MLIYCLLLPKLIVSEGNNPCLCKNGGILQTVSLFIHNARYRTVFLLTIFWVLVIRISNKHYVYVGCKIVGNGEESG